MLDDLTIGLETVLSVAVRLKTQDELLNDYAEMAGSHPVAD
jgi:hypothetical protein